MEFRNNYQTFLGKIKILKSNENSLNLIWEFEEFKTELNIDLFHYQLTIKYWDKNDKEMKIWDIESVIPFE